MSYRSKVKSTPSNVSEFGLGFRGVSLGVNSEGETYGGSPYTGWYNTFDLGNSPTKIVMYKSNLPMEGITRPNGYWAHNFLSDPIPLDFAQHAFTLECWVLFPTGIPTDVNLLEFDVIGIPIEFQIKTGGQLRFLINGTTIVNSSTSLTNAWHHIVFSRDINNMLNIYIDGNNVGSASVTNTLTPSSAVAFFGNSSGVSMWFTNLRVVTQTAIYPTESAVGSVPFYPLNKSYDDTAVLVLGKKASNFVMDYSNNNVSWDFEGSPSYDIEGTGPLLNIIDAVIGDANPWNMTNAQAAMLKLIQGHPQRFGQPYFANVNEAVQWAFNGTIAGLLFSNVNYYDEDLSGDPYFGRCEMFLDSGYVSSYPLVGNRHYNLRSFGTSAGLIGSYNFNYNNGGMIYLPKDVITTNPLSYETINIGDLRSFTYYGIFNVRQTSPGTFDFSGNIVGMFDGTQNWRVVSVGGTHDCNLVISNSSGNEITVGSFAMPPMYPGGYVSLIVSYNNTNGDINVFVNGQPELNINNLINRSNTNPGSGSIFVVNRESKLDVEHYVSALYTTPVYLNAANMNSAFNNGRYPGIA